jgi:hypothetical protein
MKTFEYRTGFENDPHGEKLTGELAARLGLEHARRRRIYWAHWTAAAGILVWVYALSGGSHRFRIVALSTFAAFLLGWPVLASHAGAQDAR